MFCSLKVLKTHLRCHGMTTCDLHSGQQIKFKFHIQNINQKQLQEANKEKYFVATLQHFQSSYLCSQKI